MRFPNLRSVFTRNVSKMLQHLSIKEMSHKVSDAIENDLVYRKFNI